MAIPSVDELNTPLLEELADGRECSTRELRERLALRFCLSGEELAERTPGGRSLFDARVQRARTRLRERGLLEYPRRAHSRITEAGLEALRATTRPAPPSEPLPEPYIGPGPLEAELRSLTGPAAADEADWTAIRLLSGWGRDGVLSYAEVAGRTGRSVDELRGLMRRCRSGHAGEAPVLDSVLAFVCAHPWMEPDHVAFHLAQLGFVWSRFSIAGLAEAARRFGRVPQWRMLVRQLATARGRGEPEDYRRLPRPFESWFEVEVFLFLEDRGYRAWPEERGGQRRRGLVVESGGGPLVIECDGAQWYRGDSEHTGIIGLLGDVSAVMRISYADWTCRTLATQHVLLDTIAELGPLRSVG